MFKLNIECSKDFEELHIKFADGTAIVQTGPKKEPSPKAPKVSKPEPDNPPQRKEEYLGTETYTHDVSQEIIKPPEISRNDKPVKVAEELQNLDI